MEVKLTHLNGVWTIQPLIGILATICGSLLLFVGTAMLPYVVMIRRDLRDTALGVKMALLFIASGIAIGYLGFVNLT